MTSDHERWEELSAGYALHALEPDEELEFTEHLSGCPACRDSLRDHELVAAQLGALAHDDEAETPPGWQSLRRHVVGDESPPAPPEAAPPAEVVALSSRRRPWARPRLLGAAAALVVLAGAGIVVGETVGGSSPTTATQAIDSCRHRTGCSVVRLHTPDGTAPAVVLVSDDHATMVPTAMAAPPAGKTYVLWQLLRNGGPAAVDSFADARDVNNSPLVMPYADTAAFAVSMEAAGVPPSQPTHVIAVGNTSA